MPPIEITENDTKAIIKKINESFDSACVRAYMSLLNGSLEDFLIANEEALDANLVIIRSDDDLGHAAKYRNSGQNALFIFTEDMREHSYITSCSKLIRLPSSLRLRVFRAWCEANEIC